MTFGALAPVSQSCGRSNAEVEQVVDAKLAYVYEEWIGCNGIGFARSLDGGYTFQHAVTLPGSSCPVGVRCQSWDPAIALGPGGTVYAAFMTELGGDVTPVVDVSTSDGEAFEQSVKLHPTGRGNWGDRDFIAVAPNGVIYVTWDYGPQYSLVHLLCPPGGSCSFDRGDLNGAFQKSTDGGRTWTPIKIFTPGYPAGGVYGAPLLVQPDGTIDALYIGHGGGHGYQLAPGYEWFTSSSNGGRTWTRGVRLGPADLTESLAEWWIDGDLSTDAVGNLYATWDTQSAAGDIGWLSYSADHGRTWSTPLRVTADHDNAVHIVECAGSTRGLAYVAWLTDAPTQGYAMYIRPFSILKGWLGPASLVPSPYGAKTVWPGDTFGITAVPGGHVYLSWGIGSAKPAPSGNDQINETTVTYDKLL